METLKKFFMIWTLLLALVSLFAAWSCNEATHEENVIQLDTYLIFATENGEKSSAPIFPGELSINYISDVLENSEQIYKNLKSTYGYEVFSLKGETRDLIRFKDDPQELSAQLDTLYFRLNYQTTNDQTSFSIRLQSRGLREPKEKLHTRLSFAEGKTIVLGMGQPGKEKRSALFLILHPKTITVSGENDLDKLSALALPDMSHRLQAYRLEKQIRKKLKLPQRIIDDFENLYEFFNVTQKPKIKTKGKPTYPEKARKAGVEGTVVVTIVIREDGSVGKSLIFMSRNDQLDSASIDAAQKCVFTPGEVNGRKVKTMMNIPFRFRLSGAKKDVYAFPEAAFRNKLSSWPKVLKKIDVRLPKNFDLKLLPDMNVVSVMVDENGKVISAEIYKAARSKELDKLSIEAAGKFLFSPGEINGEPAKIKMLIPFKYKAE